MNNITPLAYNIEQAAKALGVSRPIMTRLVHTDGFPVIRIGTRRCLIPVEDLRHWMTKQVNNHIVLDDLCPLNEDEYAKKPTKR